MRGTSPVRQRLPCEDADKTNHRRLAMRAATIAINLGFGLGLALASTFLVLV